MIPTEIVNHILGLLHSDEDYTTLKICLVVFPELVERYLYSRISFTEPPAHLPPTFTFNKKQHYVVDLTKLSRALIDRPHVAKYVRSVHIFIHEYHSLQVTSSILPKLPQIESIALVGSQRHLTWHMLDPAFHTIFQNTIRLPSIEGVAISGIGLFPLNVLDDCRNLKHLLLFTQCTGEGASTPHLRSLGVQNQGDLMMTKVITSIKSNALHSLSLRPNDRTKFTQIRDLIEACSASLVNIELDHRFYVEPDGGNSFEDLTFPALRVQLPLLQRITIHSPIIMTLTPGKYLSSLPLLVPFFFSIPRIHPISLCLRLDFLARPLDFDWSDAAAFLVLPVFRHPIEVRVTTGTASLSEIVSSFTQHSDLKRLYETGKLAIQSMPDHDVLLLL